jgi:hypothetical protein
MQDDVDEGQPSEEEMDANPYAAEDQSETASAVIGSATSEDAPNGGDGGNALQQRLQRRTDPAQVDLQPGNRPSTAWS